MSLFTDRDLADLEAGKASAATQVLAAVQIERLRQELATIKRPRG